LTNVIFSHLCHYIFTDSCLEERAEMFSYSKSHLFLSHPSEPLFPSIVYKHAPGSVLSRSWTVILN